VSGTVEPTLSVTKVRASFEGSPLGTPGRLRIDYTVRNEGNVRLAGVPIGRVTGPFGWGQRRWSGEPLPELLPGDAVSGSVVVDDVWHLGRLRVDVEVTSVSSGDQVLEPAPTTDPATTTAWAIPWAPMLLLLLLVGSWWWLRHRRRLADRPREKVEQPA